MINNEDIWVLTHRINYLADYRNIIIIRNIIITIIIVVTNYMNDIIIIIQLILLPLFNFKEYHDYYYYDFCFL